MSITTSLRRSLPSRLISAGLQATTELARAGIETGIDVATIPLREGAKALSGELSRATLRRHCWRGNGRAWIEVRGLADAADGPLGPTVLEAILAHPGVASAKLNRPLSRVVVDLDDPDTSLSDLCRVVEEAENRCPTTQDAGQASASLPGDGLVLATRAVTVAANAAGLGVALFGRATRLPRLPVTIAAGITFFDYQPWLRRRLEDRIGGPATDTVMTLVQATSQTLSQSPTSLSLGLTMQSLKVAECRAEARAWEQHEPELARHADQPLSPARRGRSRRGAWSARPVASPSFRRSAPARSAPAPAT